MVDNSPLSFAFFADDRVAVRSRLTLALRASATSERRLLLALLRWVGNIRRYRNKGPTMRSDWEGLSPSVDPSVTVAGLALTFSMLGDVGPGVFDFDELLVESRLFPARLKQLGARRSELGDWSSILTGRSK